MDIIMIRHFQTYGNTKKQYIGTTDEPLLRDADFDECVQKSREKLRNPELLFASPLKRCKETARCLFPDMEAAIVPEFRECDFGLFEGKNYEELKDHPQYQKWLNSVGTIPFPNGESHEKFKSRCVSGFERVIQQLINDRTTSAALVVHGGTIMAIMEAFAMKDNHNFYDWQVKNGAGYVVHIDNQTWKSGIHRFEEIRAL